MTADAMLGKTPEAAEAAPIGSGYDVRYMDLWTMWEIPSNRSA